MIRDKVKLEFRRFVQGAFRDVLDVDAVCNSWDKGYEAKCGEGRSSYLALDDSRCAKQRVATDRLCGRFK